MNKIFLFLIAMAFFSCNSSGTADPEEKKVNAADTNTDTPAQEKSLRSLIDQYPDSLSLRNNLVKYFASNNNYESAIKENDLLLKKDSMNADLWDSKARLHFLNNDTVAAVKALERTVALFPAPQYVISLATAYAQVKNQAAISLADTLLKRNKAEAGVQAIFIKGLYYANTGDKKNAIDYFDQCMHMDYTFLDAYREKAMAQFSLGKYLDALKTLELEIAVNQHNEEAYYWMGRCFEKLDKKEEAIQNYRLALQFDPEYIEAKDALGKMAVTP